MPACAGFLVNRAAEMPKTRAVAGLNQAEGDRLRAFPLHPFAQFGEVFQPAG